MDTILDYIRWRGDIPFSVDGLREADALVLCMLSYYDLKPMWADHEGPIHLRDCQKLIDAITKSLVLLFCLYLCHNYMFLMSLIFSYSS